MVGRQYNLTDYSQIINTSFVLPKNVLNVIENLNNLTGSCSSNEQKPTRPTIQNKIVFSKTPNIENNWNDGKNYKSLPSIPKEGIDKIITEIKIALNKLSNKNADTQKGAIFELIEKVEENSLEKEEDLKKIANTIFEIASSNKFYSEIYAELYKSLLDKFSIFSPPLYDLLMNYKNTFQTINAVNPNDDYDGFCVYVKSNDKRKATTAFIINLTKKEIFTKEEILELIIYLQNLIVEFSQLPKRIEEVEEITENLFIIGTEGKPIFAEFDLWNKNIVPKFLELSVLRKTDATKYSSMSNRATFKYKDILDFLAKK